MAPTVLERRICVAHRARDPDVVAGLRARARESLPFGKRAHRRDRDRHGRMRAADLSRSGRVAPEKRAARALRKGHQAAGKARKPFVVTLWQSDREKERSRRRACGRKVRQIDGEGLVADVLGPGAGQKVRAHGHHVGRHRNAPGGHVDDGAVVSHALAVPDAEGGMREIPLDDGKFTVLNHFVLLRSTMCSNDRVRGTVQTAPRTGRFQK